MSDVIVMPGAPIGAVILRPQSGGMVMVGPAQPPGGGIIPGKPGDGSTLLEDQVGPPGPPGKTGTAGSTGPVATIVCAEAVPAIGLPVYVDRASRQLRLARADTYRAAFVAGLAIATSQSGFTCPVQCGQVVVADWTPIIGTPDLAPGLVYFLALMGGLTTTPPLGLPGVAIVTIGRAADARTLFVAPSNPILQ